MATVSVHVSETRLKEKYVSRFQYIKEKLEYLPTCYLLYF